MSYSHRTSIVVIIAFASGLFVSLIFACLYTYIQRRARRNQSTILLDRWLSSTAKNRPLISNPTFLETKGGLLKESDTSTGPVFLEKIVMVPRSPPHIPVEQHQVLSFLPLYLPSKPVPAAMTGVRQGNL